MSLGSVEGLLLVDKPSGITSHDVVAMVRRATQVKKVGHAGTLDPMATGLLVLGLGRATRLLRFLGDLPKTYEGTFRLGVETTTLDAEGDVTGEAPVADYVCWKSFTARTPLSDAEMQSPALVDRILGFARTAWPLLEWGWAAADDEAPPPLPIPKTLRPPPPPDF